MAIPSYFRRIFTEFLESSAGQALIQAAAGSSLWTTEDGDEVDILASDAGAGVESLEVVGGNVDIDLSQFPPDTDDVGYAIGDGATASAPGSMAFGGGATYGGTTSPGASASGLGAQAFGLASTASGDSAQAGPQGEASGNFSRAGPGATAFASNADAGPGATASEDNARAGPNATASGDTADAGPRGLASGDQSWAGPDATASAIAAWAGPRGDADGIESLALQNGTANAGISIAGQNATTDAAFSIAGPGPSPNPTTVNSGADGSIALMPGATVESDASNALAIGENALASADGARALGNESTASALRAVAGPDATASAVEAWAGPDATASALRAWAGPDATASADQSWAGPLSTVDSKGGFAGPSEVSGQIANITEVNAGAEGSVAFMGGATIEGDADHSFVAAQNGTITSGISNAYLFGSSGTLSTADTARFDGLTVETTEDINQSDGDGSLIHSRATKSADFSTGDAGYYSVDTSGGAVTATIATADAVDGKELNFKRNGVNTVTVDTEGTATIDGGTEYELTSDDDSLTAVYNPDNDDWEVY
jgi:hypothetical protein